MLNSIEEGRKEDGNLSIADKILRKIKENIHTISDNYGRWAWELLQNAKDSVADSERKVSVKLEYQKAKNSVIFSHTGDIFTDKDVRGVINQITSKEADENVARKKIGQFGTGFITTHLLSKMVHVKGIVQAEEGKFEFDFPLDRQGTTMQELAEKIESTWKNFHQSTTPISAFERNQYNTSFTYPLQTDRQHEIAQKGIEEFMKLMPFVLAFIPNIEKVTIITNEDTHIFQQLINLDPYLFDIEKKGNSSTKIFQIALVHDEIATVAVEVDSDTKVAKPLDTIPKLFCEFPLVGTETFYFPAIINSFAFHPQTERNGIWLKTNAETKEAFINQQIIEHSITLYEKLLTYLSQTGIKSLYNVVNTSIPKIDTRYFDEQWYEEKVQKPLREFIRAVPIVDTVKHGRKALSYFSKSEDRIRFVRFPVGEKEIRHRIWKLYNSMGNITGHIPQQIELDNWLEVIWQEENKWSLPIFVKAIANTTSLEILKSYLLGEYINPIQWLNELYQIIIDAEELDLFDKNEIILTQNLDFKSRVIRNGVGAHLDKIQDETLLNILELLGKNWRSILAHPQINVPLHHQLTKVDAANAITNSYKNEFKGYFPKEVILLLCE